LYDYITQALLLAFIAFSISMSPDHFNRLLAIMQETHKPFPIETDHEREAFNAYKARREAAKAELRNYFSAI
tara:strand:- start:357 stop:572 length:216 start_codon:yes stop_codon:yes gene_type:complete